ncbi:sortase domain-bontaining protein [Streptomyces sp. NPDC048650]|uniref:sortase domain-containing protein n=1 Tax=unclassified Streptomyces TaxID=2593676 RepID=UPI0037172C13
MRAEEGREAAPRAVARIAGSARLLTGVAWALLLLGLWLWGWGMPGDGAEHPPATGDIAAVGRPPGRLSPRVHDPVAASVAARPTRIAIPALGVHAVVARRLAGETPATASPCDAAEAAGWYADGPAPGAPGVALLAGPPGGGHRAALHGLAGIELGERVDVGRSDGGTAQFTVEDVRFYDRDDLDAHEVYGAHERGRSELRLVSCDGAFEPARHTRRAHVVVSAYLTGYREAPPVAG